MSDLNHERWRRISPLLDAALTMDDSSREDYLISLETADPELAAELRALLEEQRHLGDFLDGVVTLPGSGHPEAIGPYRVLGTLGEGGMGVVYLAQQTEPVERRIAVKVVRLLGGKSLMARFEYERRALAMMEHPNVARLYDAGVSAQGHPFFAMEYVAGEPVTKYCDARRLSLPRRLRIFQQVCAGVHHAHQKGVIHRDLKPSNILVTDQDGVAVPKVIDFGVAKALNAGSSANALRTEVGARIGTPRYMSPEQDSGKDIDSTSDIYSLGVLLYELLAGVTPDRDDDPVSPLARVRRMDPKDAEEIARNRACAISEWKGLLKGDLEWITLKALHRDRTLRYASASEFAADIERHLLDQPVLARAPGAMYTLGKLVRRNRVSAVLGVLAVIATIGGAVATWSQSRTARAQRDFAYRQLMRAEEINDLDSFVMHDVAPAGKPLTVFALLERAEKMVEHQAASNPLSHVSLLISIGQQYKTMDAEGRAKQVLERAYQRSRGLSDVSTRSRASCALASIAADSGQNARGKDLWREGLRELPAGDPAYALDRNYCLRAASAVAGHLGESDDAISFLLRARQELQIAPYRTRVADLAILMDLAEAYRGAGRLRESISTSEEAAALMTELGRDQTERAGTLFNNWALTLGSMGRELEAEKLYRRAIEVSQTIEGEDSASPMLLLNYGRVLGALRRDREAAGYVQRAQDRAGKTGLESVVLQSLLVQNAIYRNLNDAEKATRALNESAPLLRRMFPPDHSVFASEASLRSLTAQAGGEWRQALQFADQAVNLTEEFVKTRRGPKEFLPLVLYRRSTIRLKLEDAVGAAADAQRSYDLFRVDLAANSYSSNVGRASLALAHAKQAQGQDAREFFRIAVEHFRPSLGDAHPLTLEASRLAASR
jgi:non-specific serine/threonine protein kinase/serine/threonine-protein kinase